MRSVCSDVNLYSTTEGNGEGDGFDEGEQKKVSASSILLGKLCQLWENL
jgi:hypothetical protein